jgi:hypothetical protein
MESLGSIIEFILKHNLFKKNKKRAFFLLLSLAPPNKYVSKLFIQDKIEESLLQELLPQEIYNSLGDNYLDNIRIDFYKLGESGLIERVDMSPCTLKNFQRFCKTNVVGSYFILPHNKRSQLFQRISSKGKGRVRDILAGKV